MTTLTQNLLDLSDFAWQRLRARVEGLTDDEYFWEPFPGCWSVRKTADGFAPDDNPLADPPPFTTLAWRITHIIDILQEDRTATWFGQQPAPEDGTPPVPSNATEAIKALEHSYAVWRGRLAALSQDDLERPMGSVAGMYAEHDGTAFALHILDELIHHGAEVGTVRDFYSGQRAEDPLVVALLQGDRSTASEEALDLLRRQRPGLIAEAAAAQRWEALPLLIELGFDVSGRTGSGKTAAHFAAGAGNLSALRLLVAEGTDLSLTDGDFGATPLGWAEWFKQAEAADFLRKQDVS
jgi:DinB family protein/ankyrin repeat protein